MLAAEDRSDTGIVLTKISHKMDDTDRRHTPLKEISNTPHHESYKGNHSKPCVGDQQKYTLLMKQARKAAEEGHPRESLQLLIKASKIHDSEKVMKRIAKIEEYLRENGSESESDEDSGMHHIGKGFYIQKDLYSQLYSYQREALMWFWRLHRKNKGGILGDDMGLGKTIQVIAFLSGLFYLEQVKTVLVVLPVALIINWEKEFDKWAPGIFVESHHSNSKRERERALAKVQRRGGVLLTSYGLVLTNHELLSHRNGNSFTWDYVILDEGHKIKNPSKTTKAVHKVPATHRIILTGTPIQNNLKELWALFDFVTQGTLLGTAQTFNCEYANPITRAREKDATGGERLLGNQMAESLRELIAPYFLRRTKADVVKRREECTDNLDDQEKANEKEERVPEFPTLTRKNDFVIWLHLTDAQIKIYRDFISLDQVKELLMTSRSPLVELTILKKLCDHPRLLPVRACVQLGLETADDTWADNEEDDSETSNSKNQPNKAIQSISDDVLMMESCKLQFLVSLLTNLRQEGHRTLVFSQSRKMLDIIEKVLKNQDFQVMRLDGTISKLEDREKRISSFQRNQELSVFLLTTQVGGVGLTLTGADRVVIFDPSWNPATDSQAVDRVYRIGQTRSVVIYRLITCGSVEEKIYRRQIFKDSLTKQATGTSKNPYRYFSRQELRDLFILDNPRTSTTQLALQEMHAAQRKTDTELDEHIAFLYSLDMFGLSDHDLMFSQEADTETKEEEEQSAEYIQHRVSRAKELVSAESDLSQKLREQIEQGTEGLGSMQRHHRRYTDRQTLLDHAAEIGQQVDVPAFNKRRDDYNRKNQSPSEDDIEGEGDEDLNMSMANLTLEELDSDVHSNVTKGLDTANLLADRPQSTNAPQGTNIICIEDSDNEDNQPSADANRRNESDQDVIEDSDTEVMPLPNIRSEVMPSSKATSQVRSPDASKNFTEQFEIPEASLMSQQEVGMELGVKDEQDRGDGNERDFFVKTKGDCSVDDKSLESEDSRLKRLATTPLASLPKMGRLSQTPHNAGESHDLCDNPGDSVQEVPATPASVIDLTDSDAPEHEADMSSSFEEIEQRTIATSPMAPSRQSLSPASPPRPISTAEVGLLERNVDSECYMESDEDEDLRKTSHISSLPALDQETSKTSPSPDPGPDASLERFYDAEEFLDVDLRHVALSPMVHDDSASEGSSESTPHLKMSPQYSDKQEEDSLELGKDAGDDNSTSKEKPFHYVSDADSNNISSENMHMQENLNVTRQLSFTDTRILKTSSDVTPDNNRDNSRSEDSSQQITDEKNRKAQLRKDDDNNEGINDRPDEETVAAKLQNLENSISFMSIASEEEYSREDNLQDSEEQNESIDDVFVSSTRRRQVIEESEEEEDDLAQDEKESSLLDQSPMTDEENKDNREVAEDEHVGKSDGDGADEEELEEDSGEAESSHDDELEDEEEEEDDEEEEEEGEGEDEYEDSFINDEENSDDGSSYSDEDYEETGDEEEEEDGEDDEVEEGGGLTDEQLKTYQDLVARGRHYQSNGNMKKALSAYLKALDIDSSDPALQRRAYKLAQQFKQQASHS